MGQITVLSRRSILNRYMDQESYSFEGIGQARDGCIMTAFGAWLELTFRAEVCQLAWYCDTYLSGYEMKTG
jgi:hypothetical protein